MMSLMKTILTILVICSAVAVPIRAAAPVAHQIDLSLVLTGHILLGVGYSCYFTLSLFMASPPDDFNHLPNFGGTE